MKQAMSNAIQLQLITFLSFLSVGLRSKWFQWKIYTKFVVYYVYVMNINLTILALVCFLTFYFLGHCNSSSYDNVLVTTLNCNNIHLLGCFFEGLASPFIINKSSCVKDI